MRPSTIISLYLVFSVLFDAVQCRTLWLLPGAGRLAAVFSAALAVKVAWFLVEIQGKRRFLLAAWRRLGPESTSGIVSRGLFWWLNDLMMRGFRASLSMATLYETDQELRSELLLDRLRKAFEGKNRSGRYALVFAVLRCVRPALLSTIVPRVLLIGFKFSQPFLINRVITYVEGDRGDGSGNIGYGLIGATALIYIGTAVSPTCECELVLTIDDTCSCALVSTTTSSIAPLP